MMGYGIWNQNPTSATFKVPEPIFRLEKNPQDNDISKRMSGIELLED
jgi:hypothetical protein